VAKEDLGRSLVNKHMEPMGKRGIFVMKENVIVIMYYRPVVFNLGYAKIS
jgi:hypothetical protein